jgi:tight adherence protein B
VTLLVALVAGSLVFSGTLLVLNGRRRAAVTERVGWYNGPSRPETGAGPKRSLARSFESLLDRVGATSRIARALGRAGVDRTPGAFALLVLLVSFAVFVLLAIVSSPLPALLLALAVPVLAIASLNLRARRRARAFEEQLPEILDSLSASLRAGHGFDYALQTMTTEVADPAATEFRRVLAEVHLGRPMDAALRELGERVRSDDLMFVLDAIMVQRQVGGSLAELFELVSETVRSRESFRRKLRAITGMARMSATVLTLLPVAAALGLTAVNHAYEAPLFTTSLGRILCLGTICAVAVGGTILRKIGQVKP